jgi:hypothetical protein
MSADTTADRLAPAGPNRTAAHTRRGRSHAKAALLDSSGGVESEGNPWSWTIPTIAIERTSAVASSRRKVEAERSHPRCVTVRTIAGTRVSSVRVFEMTREPQTCQYCSPRRRDTAAASTNEEKNGPAITAPAMKARRRFCESNRVGASLQRRTSEAPISASLQLVANSVRDSVIGQSAPRSSVR